MEPQTTENLKPNPLFPTMAVEYTAISLLKPYSRQMRRHAQSKIRRLAKFIEKSGVIIPLVVDKDNFVILGNARLAALLLLGIESVPVIRITHLDETMIRALILADNQFTLNAQWYKEALREELLYLAPGIQALGLELIDLGFETGQLDIIIGDVELSSGSEPEAAPQSGQSVTKPGNVWVMGPHKLICGNALEEKT